MSEDKTAPIPELPQEMANPHDAFREFLQKVKDMGWSVAFPNEDSASGDADMVTGMIIGTGDFIEKAVKGTEDEWQFLINPAEGFGQHIN